MFCSECNVNYPSDHHFCVTCNGALLPGRICPSCLSKNSEKAKVCSLCGEVFSVDPRKIIHEKKTTLNKIIKICRDCGAKWDRSQIFCQKCGGELRLHSGDRIELIRQKDSFIERIFEMLGVI